MGEIKSSDAAMRLPYASPELRAYGTLESVTRQVGNMSNKNDGGGGNTKTS